MCIENILNIYLKIQFCVCGFFRVIPIDFHYIFFLGFWVSGWVVLSRFFKLCHLGFIKPTVYKNIFNIWWKIQLCRWVFVIMQSNFTIYSYWVFKFLSSLGFAIQVFFYCVIWVSYNLLIVYKKSTLYIAKYTILYM